MRISVDQKLAGTKAAIIGVRQPPRSFAARRFLISERAESSNGIKLSRIGSNALTMIRAQCGYEGHVGEHPSRVDLFPLGHAPG